MNAGRVTTVEAVVALEDPNEHAATKSPIMSAAAERISETVSATHVGLTCLPAVSADS